MNNKSDMLDRIDDMMSDWNRRDIDNVREIYLFVRSRQSVTHSDISAAFAGVMTSTDLSFALTMMLCNSFVTFDSETESYMDWS